MNHWGPPKLEEGVGATSLKGQTEHNDMLLQQHVVPRKHRSSLLSSRISDFVPIRAETGTFSLFLLNNLHRLWNVAAKPAINFEKCNNHENYLRGFDGKAETGEVRDG